MFFCVCVCSLTSSVCFSVSVCGSSFSRYVENLELLELDEAEKSSVDDIIDTIYMQMDEG